MEFKTYRRILPTRARPLTEADYQQRQGIIHTLEGPQPFAPGDFLAQDAKGEWPIQQATIAQYYIQTASADRDGFALYLRAGKRLAAQVSEAFTIQGLHGKAGDYLVLGGEGGWPVDRELFEAAYRQEPGS